MRGDAALGDVVHLGRPDLDLDWLALRPDHGRVEALVAVGLWDGDEVAEARRERRVQRRKDRVRAPAVFAALLVGAVEDDPDGEQVVDVVEPDALRAELAPDRVDALRPADDLEVESCRGQLGADRLDEALDVALALPALGVEAVRDVAVRLGLEVFQREVFEFGLDLVEAEAVRERRVEVARLGGDADLLVAGEAAERPHVVEPVGKLDQDHAHVRRHREHQLADVLVVPEPVPTDDGPDLGHAVGDRRDVVAELAPDEVERQVGVLDRVVEQGGRDRDVVGANVAGGDEGDFERVRDVHLARGAAVVAVRPVCDAERAPDQALVDGRQVAAAVFEEHAQPALVLGDDDEVVELLVERRGGLNHRVWTARQRARFRRAEGRPGRKRTRGLARCGRGPAEPSGAALPLALPVLEVRLRRRLGLSRRV